MMSRPLESCARPSDAPNPLVVISATDLEAVALAVQAGGGQNHAADLRFSGRAPVPFPRPVRARAGSVVGPELPGLKELPPAPLKPRCQTLRLRNAVASS